MSSKVNLKEVKQGDVFSEISHYKVKDVKKGGGVSLYHLESGQVVNLDDKYVQDLLTTADQFEKEVEVGKEDKKDGTKGIRSIFEEIYNSEVFTVCFRKQDEPIGPKKLKELKDAQITEVLNKIEKAKTSKKGVADEAKKALEELQNNPILPYKPGEERVLRGYKIQFSSRDGRYDCIDMDLDAGKDSAKSIRPVNINSILWLVYKGVRYIVK